MSGPVVVDTNLLVLLVVGSAGKNYISRHKRLKGVFTAEDYELLALLIAQFSDLVLLPHIVAEVSNLARHIDFPARRYVQHALRRLVSTATELPLPSILGVERAEFHQLGLTDSVILHLCSMSIAGASPTLLTVDTHLADHAHSLGYSVIDYKQEYQTG